MSKTEPGAAEQTVAVLDGIAAAGDELNQDAIDVAVGATGLPHGRPCPTGPLPWQHCYQ